jgi:hypothetical protein
LEATVAATEEAIINALVAADTVTAQVGKKEHTADAIIPDKTVEDPELVQVIRQHNPWPK